MILRDALISDERRALRSTQRPLTMDPRVDAGIEAVSDEPAAVACGAQEVAVPVEEQTPEPLPVSESSLSFESVAAWLAVQDNDIRVACASMLSHEITRLHESARIDGIAVGKAEGLLLAREKAEERCTLLQSLTAASELAFEQERLRLIELCADIVAEAFAKIAGTELLTRKATCSVVAEILKRVKEGRELTIRVRPSDFPVLQEEEHQLAAALPGRRFSLVADARVELGGSIVESKFGSLDGRLEVQLRELYETLRSAKSVHTELL